MVKKPAGFVLATLGGATYQQRTPRPPRLLRPCRTAFLPILQVLPGPSLGRSHP